MSDEAETKEERKRRLNRERQRRYTARRKMGDDANDALSVEATTKDVASTEEAPQEPNKIDITRPPRRLAIRTKTIWQTLSPELREDIILREQEFDTAFKRYDGLGKYVMQAEASGTTLQAAVESYSKLETAIRKDPLEGVVQLWGAMGVDIVAAVTAMANKYLPDSLKQAYEAGRTAGYQEGHVAGTILQFASDKPDFETLRPKMHALSAADPEMPLERLYDEARWTDPLIREQEMEMRFKRTNNQLRNNGYSAADRARMASKATVGTPSTAAASSRAPRQDNRTLEQVVADAMDRQGGR
jgi:hypothetical protein